MNDTCIQNIKIDAQVKLRDKDNFFSTGFISGPVRAILRPIFTSGALRAVLLIENFIHSADACFLLSRGQLFKLFIDLLRDPARSGIPPGLTYSQ